MMRRFMRPALAAASITALALTLGAPASAAAERSEVAPVAQAAQADWDPEAWLGELWPSLPFGEHATLELTDLSAGHELPNGSLQSLAGFVSADRPDVILLDREYVEDLAYEQRRQLLALAVHELSHSAIFQYGGIMPRAVFEISEAADRDWAGPLIDTGLSGKWAALEAIAACVEQSALPPGATVHYLSGQCPAEYRDAAFDYLAGITGGTDWRPREMKTADRALKMS
ncbi:hypothetical protein [Leucobacter salsicius]|uniref:hypothetical protein n=1 Tax=Leucobacter salsicius TaxID=664638 RepID=UPI000344C0A3|nr:hypothetical protein [Leucobacter salsicius]